jgi:AAA+ ATPase superfamily predicted ATPase
MECCDSPVSEFVAVYGRRRIGKTFLISEMFEGEFVFFAEGILDGNKATQLQNFNDEIINHGGGGLSPATNWLDAFNNLNKLLESSPGKGKKVILLDEIPSMSTINSGFLPALGHFWNRWAVARKDVLLIICGSATSWIIKNIVGNKGGLHNRLTRQIALRQFTLQECEEFFRTKGIVMTRYQIAEAYMVFGGVPYYLNFMRPQFSLYQNIDAMYFEEDAPLRDEYRFLYRSLFADSDAHMKIIKALASNGKGLTRGDIVHRTELPSNGRLSEILYELAYCGFIRDYLAYGKKERDRLWQLIDPFTLFHLRFGGKRGAYASDFWLHFSTTPAHGSWSGYAFERVCLLHVPQIKRALGISGVLAEIYSWRSKASDPGAQIDLVIERADKVIHLCEAKYASSEFMIDKGYAKILREKQGAFLRETRTQAVAHTTMITTFGLKRNAYANEILFRLSLDDLFD